MIRTLNVLALVAVIGSASAAYSVKYETILVSEKLRKRESELQRELDAVSVLKAEWQLLNRPSRLQTLATPEANMQAVSARQIARASDIPMAKPGADGVARALDGLLTGAITTPDSAKKSTGRASTTSSAALSPRPQARPGLPATPRPDAGSRPNAAGAKLANKAPATTSRPPAAAKASAGAPMVLRPPAKIENTGASARPDLIARALGLIGLGAKNSAPAR